MRRSYLPLALTIFLAIFCAGIARARESVSIDSIEVALWPEYDQPSVLGLYLVRLEADVDLPATVSLPLPDDVLEPHVVAAWFPDGRLDDDVEWVVQSQNGQRVASVTVETTGVWLEFYAPVQLQGNERSYSFRWPGGVEADSFNFEVMHPVGASGLTVEPQGQVSDSEDGLTYTRLDLGRISAGDTPELQLNYTKPEPFPASASAPPGEVSFLSLLEVALWPEFDRQETLVIYRAQLPPETQLPATVSLPIPAEASEPHAVATIGEDRNLYVAPFEVVQVGAWNWVTIDSDSLLLQVEYYAPLEIEGARRAFTYYWPGGVQLGTLQYEVQRPLSASEFKLTPAGVSQVGQDGLTYIRAALGPKESDDRLEISLAYEKSDDVLSIDTVSSQPTLERPTTTQGGTPDLTDQLPWILGGFGALLVGVGLFMLLRMRNLHSQAPKTRHRRRRKPTKNEELDSSPIYCHVCGNQASASDHFCRRCGTKLRN